MVRVRVLRELALEVDGNAVELPASRRARSLLGLLAVERRGHARSQVAAGPGPTCSTRARAPLGAGFRAAVLEELAAAGAPAPS